MAIFAETRPDDFTRFRADLYRADVHRAGLGSDGYCGFSIPMELFAWDGPYRVDAVRMGSRLQGSPAVKGGVVSPLVLRRVGDLLFGLDPAHAHFSGWLSAEREPHGRRMIGVEADGCLAARAKACLCRAAEGDGRGDPYHGFSLGIPAHRRYVRLFDLVTGTILFQQQSKAFARRPA